jgi:hypothetical protein
MKTHVKLAHTAAALLLSAALAACGSGSDSDATTTNGTSTAAPAVEGDEAQAAAGGGAADAMQRAVAADECMRERGYQPMTMPGNGAQVPVAELQAMLTADTAVVDIEATTVFDKWGDREDAPRVTAYFFADAERADAFRALLSDAEDAFVTLTTTTDEFGDTESRDTRPQALSHGPVAVLVYDAKADKQADDLRACGLIAPEQELDRELRDAPLTADDHTLLVYELPGLALTCSKPDTDAGSAVRSSLKHLARIMERKSDTVFEDLNGDLWSVKRAAQRLNDAVTVGQACKGPEADALAAALAAAP